MYVRDMMFLKNKFKIEPLSLRQKRNLVKIVHKTSKVKANVDITA